MSVSTRGRVARKAWTGNEGHYSPVTPRSALVTSWPKDCYDCNTDDSSAEDPASKHQDDGNKAAAYRIYSSFPCWPNRKIESGLIIQIDGPNKEGQRWGSSPAHGLGKLQPAGSSGAGPAPSRCRLLREPSLSIRPKFILLLTVKRNPRGIVRTW